MAELVNLRRARKAQERMRRQAASAEARIKHGRSAAERSLAQKEQESSRARLDGHRIESSDNREND